ncbi:calcium-activated potassium channel slowpoke-like [Dendronephthya gigantea]|uniref:calcium-activated potassium channel slowpoke-like n=1 Tax=Dendronephthya gigantea TaxID=151771 RepID=UPI00106D19F7|nr:calcium-activated potassium channel slowpoke-like [Dendronephthya gigantea]
MVLDSDNCKDELVSKDERKWHYFILTSVTIFFGGLFFILCGKLLVKLCERNRSKTATVTPPNSAKSRKSATKRPPSNNDEDEGGLYIAIKEGAGSLINAKTLKGKVMAILSFLFSMTYIALYYVESQYPVEHCLKLGDQKLWIFEIALNTFFIFHFIVRFLAANDKLLFWFELTSIIDFFTVPQVFVSIVVEQTWLGMRFLRALQLLRLSEVLQILGILHSAGSIEMASVIGNFVGLWVTSAGMVHMLENTGDPFGDHEYEGQHLNPFDCLYFLLVTMSTVGYGDIYCHTYLGKIFICIFICVGLVMFTSAIPVIGAFLASQSKYNSSFKTTEGVNHVVVCGHITKDTVETFLREFLHPDRDDVNEHVVFLYPSFPSSELEAVLKRNEVNVSYFKGTVLDGGDCERVQMREATAVLILANRHCSNPDAEDAANIMRVISIKNFSSKIRVVIQLLQYHNKMHLFNIRSWDMDNGDDMVCVSELKLGFIAQSCLSQGFSTLLANIFAMRSEPSEDEQVVTWKGNYLLGASKEMYTETLSPAFVGMDFHEFVLFCFEKLGLTLLAIQLRAKDGTLRYVLNPCDENARVVQGSKGCFIADSAIEVKRVFLYCNNCHKNVNSPEQIEECKCSDKGSCKTVVPPAIVNMDENDTCIELYTPNKKKPTMKKAASKLQDLMGNGKLSMFDSTGTYYWCEKVDFETATVDRTKAEQIVFNNHIVVCVFAESDGPLIGLRTFCIPLRASNLQPGELKKIVFVGDGVYLRREWEQLCNFPEINILPGSPFNRADLNAVNANLAAMVVVLSPIVRAADSANDDQALADKEPIMASLNLKAMPFDDVATVLQREMVAHLTTDDDSTTPVSQPNRILSVSKLEEISAVLPMITELVFDNNVQYLDDEDEDEDGIGFYETQPFACGHAFTVSVLDSLMTATYFNSDVLNLVRALVTGGVSAELEAQFAEGREIRGVAETPDIALYRQRAKLVQVPIYEGPFKQFGDGRSFGQLFTHAIKEFHMVCIGVYRLIGGASSRRYVITSPEAEFTLNQTDLIFGLAQSDFEVLPEQ